ncbi:MAG: alkaline phosphatase family protein [Lachnospiraceae bacterium]|nr:alkaline phosphatase family protein [Lachnospiraceae bacterium]
MKIKYPDYNNCSTNLACSVLKEFGVDTGKTKGLPLCDELFQKNYKNIAVLLLDGMGVSILQKNLKKDGFFNRHLALSYSSVFPPTTVAATTSIDSGKYPAEHCWLGWDCYYKEIDENVTVFLNTKSGTEEPAADYYVAGKFCGYENIVSRIVAAGGQAYYSTPFAYPNPGDFDAICERVEHLCRKPGKKYIYAYWNEPDHTMHRTGCFGQEAVEVLEAVERRVEQMCEHLEDTLLLITADHGHMDSAGAAIIEYPKLMECLVRLPSIEPRALNLFIKDGYHEQFVTEFKKEFGEKFLLFTKKEVKEKQLFGPGEEHPQFDGMLGDYLAMAVDDLSIYNTIEEKEKFKGVHAGLTEEEMVIPLLVVEKKQEERKEERWSE